METVNLEDRRADALGNLDILLDELICAILGNLSAKDVARLACVSSVMYIFCNEEPLWMNICLNNAEGQLQYKGSWKKTTLYLMQLPNEYLVSCRKPLHFHGFNSLFLYKRFYRCYTTLDGFSFDSGNVERGQNLSLEEFQHKYDGKKPVLLSGLANTWSAMHTWTTDQLLRNYGDTAFKLSQISSRKITMKFKEYVSYMKFQHDEDPLYIFDDKFGEVGPDLLKDYSVPYLFREDFFDILDEDHRPSFRWLIIGPERSGASWHVDPALTSAWNTLLCGRKRWALYPPGRVPLGVTVHVNEEDGDVNIDTPSSLQWWLDYYPLLADEDKPIECTQVAGETIYVPSGWWHCVLNLETTIAVTQNFVNSKNLEYVCLDMAPGYHHKGICRAGLIAIDDCILENFKKNACYGQRDLNYSDVTRKRKKSRLDKSVEPCKHTTRAASNNDSRSQEFCYDIDFLASFLDEGRDHFSSLWCSSNCIGQRELREWLCKLWRKKPEMRGILWKGACLALNAGKWLERAQEVCLFHNVPHPTDDERLPVGTGSNPVYLAGDYAIKIFTEEGIEASMYCLGTELEFYNLIREVSSLKKHIPDVLGSGIIYRENGNYKIVPWNGKGVPDVIAECGLIPEKTESAFSFGVWRKKQFEFRKVGMALHKLINSAGYMRIWPYIITKRCKGKIFAHLRETLSWEDLINLASFLGTHLRHIHLLPYPLPCSTTFSDSEQKIPLPLDNDFTKAAAEKFEIPAEWEVFVRTLNRKKKDVTIRLTKWGDPIPGLLIKKVHEYIPDDFAQLLYMHENRQDTVYKPCSWIHSDIMDDNIVMELSHADLMHNGHIKSPDIAEGKWRPSHILDFSNLSVGDPISDLIPIHLDVFRGDSRLLRHFLESYKLHLVRGISKDESMQGGNKFGRLSYHAMCYCILHDENVLGAIFDMWKELRMAESWEAVEERVWGELNNYRGFR